MRSASCAGAQPPEVDDAATDREVVEGQDFASRNVIMSNALPGAASPAAGALAAQRDLGLDPAPDEGAATEGQPAARDRPVDEPTTR